MDFNTPFLVGLVMLVDVLLMLFLLVYDMILMVLLLVLLITRWEILAFSLEIALVLLLELLLLGMFLRVI